ncbi:MAG: thiol-disulfide oxidoreductase DCC family protein [Halothiobacillaceae bacterium]
MSDQNQASAGTTVFFDGSCSLCAREIRHYRQLAGSGAMRWVDASCDDSALAAAGLDRESAMRRLHVLESPGRWAVGLDAFLVIWRHLPRYRWVGRLLGSALVRPLFSRLYDRFADWRYRRRCKTGCAMPRGE